ncbi:superinfection immunity protein [Leptospira sarikeiensis]|uniref:Superinfection immunity protein n=1 Tax=Leptospira sarikeiensis TaxID=2484943 RepID=A0A4R9KBR8_9LEPT|nr:superinfection immunity protein [Leptospira sarikeiensis]
MFILFLLGIYFIPSIIAWVKKNNFTLVILINVFAGWTGIGWIAAFVLSVVKIKSK